MKSSDNVEITSALDKRTNILGTSSWMVTERATCTAALRTFTANKAHCETIKIRKRKRVG